ncbi:MAG TPA: DUF1501 domain-containing protein, partial [Acidobacteriota bacterium]|nr:DUF1501 domain-containing protein [Acidobacteriota bacterium]
KPGTATGGEFKAIPTAVPGIQICEHLPLLAKQMKDLAIVRSMNSKEGNHDRARYFVHTGYAPAGVTQHPSFGAVVASELIDKSQKLPAYISINGPAVGPGLLGVNFAPFVIRDPEKPLDNLAYDNSVTRERFQDRLELLSVLNANFDASHGQPDLGKKEAVYQRAIDLMNSPALSAFDLTKESSTLRASYGNTKIGTGCLMARRLIQNGVKFVEVEMGGWDTHQDNFNTNRELLAQLDPAYSSLIADLRQTGLLDSTLVVWMGEFGRTPQINAKAGRDHWPQSWCAVVAGGGIKGGQFIGDTDSRGYEIKDDPVSIPDLYATLCKCLGINDSKYNSSPLGRPIRIVDHGNVITRLV